MNELTIAHEFFIRYYGSNENLQGVYNLLISQAEQMGDDVKQCMNEIGDDNSLMSKSLQGIACQMDCKGKPCQDGFWSEGYELKGVTNLVLYGMDTVAKISNFDANKQLEVPNNIISNINISGSRVYFDMSWDEVPDADGYHVYWGVIENSLNKEITYLQEQNYSFSLSIDDFYKNSAFFMIRSYRDDGTLSNSSDILKLTPIWEAEFSTSASEPIYYNDRVEVPIELTNNQLIYGSITFHLNLPGSGVSASGIISSHGGNPGTGGGGVDLNGVKAINGFKTTVIGVVSFDRTEMTDIYESEYSIQLCNQEGKCSPNYTYDIRIEP
ncbi:hypothetical protein [Pseudoalteromonas gelatinilytica]